MNVNKKALMLSLLVLSLFVGTAYAAPPEYTMAQAIPQPLHTYYGNFSHVKILARHIQGIQKVMFATWIRNVPGPELGRCWLNHTGNLVYNVTTWEVWEGDLPSPISMTNTTRLAGYFDIYGLDLGRTEYSFDYYLAPGSNIEQYYPYLAVGAVVAGAAVLYYWRKKKSAK